MLCTKYEIDIFFQIKLLDNPSVLHSGGDSFFLI